VVGTVSAGGGTLAVPDGASVQVPKGALKASTTVTIAAEAPPTGPSDAWPADPLGLAWSIDLGGATLAKPVTLTVPFDPSALPAGTDRSQVLLAYQDPASGVWTPIVASVDPVAHTVTATVSHLSTWALFTINWDYWLAFLKKAASGSLTDLLSGLRSLSTACLKSSKGFTIDDSTANKMFQACLTKTTTTGTTVTVTNLRAFALDLQSFPHYLGDQLVGPGDTVSFKVPMTDPSPAKVVATMSSQGMLDSVVDILVRLTPDSGQVTSSKDYGLAVETIAAGLAAVWQNLQISNDLQAGNYAAAAEGTVTLITGVDFISAFVAGAKAAGVKYGFPILASLSTDVLTKILAVVNLGDLIVTTWSFFGDYFFNAQTDATVTWTQLKAPAAPTALSLTVTSAPPCGITPTSDPSSRVEVFDLHADMPGLEGPPVSCSQVLTKLKGWLSAHAANTAPGNLGLVPDQYGGYGSGYANVFLAKAGALSIRFTFGGNTDYTPPPCGVYALAFNPYGTSKLVRAGAYSYQ
jgi:hypothetical protein